MKLVSLSLALLTLIFMILPIPMPFTKQAGIIEQIAVSIFGIIFLIVGVVIYKVAVMEERGYEAHLPQGIRYGRTKKELIYFLLDYAYSCASLLCIYMSFKFISSLLL